MCLGSVSEKCIGSYLVWGKEAVWGCCDAGLVILGDEVVIFLNGSLLAFSRI